MSKVLVLKGDSYKAVGEIFAARGYDVLYGVENLSAADVIVFTGGSDVSPYVYGEEPDGARGCDPKRDDLEVSIYEMYSGEVPMIGICRGGQLLNVLNGGKMIQDLGETVSGDVMMGFPVHRQVRVDHHQGMIAGDDGEPLAWNEEYTEWPDYEIWYSKTKSLCVQYHPEWGHEGTEERFFELVDQYIGGNDGVE